MDRQGSASGLAAAPGFTGRLSITVIILTFNEEMHIERCIKRVQPLVERIVVVDSFSKDRTVEIAIGMGAEVYQRVFTHQADQFQWALDTCNIVTEWVLRLDADEYLEEALVGELCETLPALPLDVTGINLKRKVIFRDKWIRYGGYYPSIFLRLWRRGAARVEQRWMDEHMVLLHGLTVSMKNDFVDHNLQDITWWTDKHNRFATRQMVDFINLEHQLFSRDEADHASNPHAEAKRFLRNRVFARAPLYLRSVAYFIYRYFLRLGFIDGKEGFIFHTLHGFWYFILIDAKIDEARTFIRGNGIEAFRKHLVNHYNIIL